MKSYLNNTKTVLVLSLIAITYVAYTIYNYMPDNNEINMGSQEVIDPLLDHSADDSGGLIAQTVNSSRNLEETFLSINWPNYPKRNPFQPYKEDIEKIVKHNQLNVPKKKIKQTKTEASIPSLTAIIISNNSKFAVLDTQVLSIGDSINGYVINDIQEHKIDLSGPNGQEFINLIEAKNHEHTKQSL